MSFFIAMHNRRATASFYHPQSIISERSEFLIVARSGERNQYLSISVAGQCTGLEQHAPSELKPANVFLATLVSQGTNGQETFIVESVAPERPIQNGSFVAGEGFFVLSEDDQDIVLKGTVRLQPGVLEHPAATGAHLMFEEDDGAVLHFDASYLPWSEELVPGGFRRGVQSLPLDEP